MSTEEKLAQLQKIIDQRNMASKKYYEKNKEVLIPRINERNKTYAENPDWKKKRNEQSKLFMRTHRAKAKALAKAEALASEENNISS